MKVAIIYETAVFILTITVALYAPAILNPMLVLLLIATVIFFALPLGQTIKNHHVLSKATTRPKPTQPIDIAASMPVATTAANKLEIELTTDEIAALYE